MSTRSSTEAKFVEKHAMLKLSPLLGSATKTASQFFENYLKSVLFWKHLFCDFEFSPEGVDEQSLRYLNTFTAIKHCLAPLISVFHFSHPRPFVSCILILEPYWTHSTKIMRTQIFVRKSDSNLMCSYVGVIFRLKFLLKK